MAVIALVLLAGTGQFGTGGWGPVKTAVTRGASISNVANSESITQRVLVWQGSLDLIADRPTPSYATDGLANARHLVGYGTEMFQYVYPLRSPPELDG